MLIKPTKKKSKETKYGEDLHNIPQYRMDYLELKYDSSSLFSMSTTAAFNCVIKTVKHDYMNWAPKLNEYK